jgi:phosphogluconate dehydratase
MSNINDTLHHVTQRVIERSKPTRSAYLDLIKREGDNMGERSAVSCSNLAHAYAGALEDQAALVSGRGANIGIVTAITTCCRRTRPIIAIPNR